MLRVRKGRSDLMDDASLPARDPSPETQVRSP